ncbi:MAG TPA: RluA family pseudouridine synthase [Gemmatimonadaceae bacterium]|nr:RluA family pseudouridine synthase [Gemmatimonadaceae bacterium]
MSGAGDAGARYEFVVPPGSAARLDLAIVAATGLSRNQAATLIATGQVTIDGRRERASFRPLPGARIVVDLPPAPDHPLVAEDIPLSIVYEDESLLVVDKAAGMVVHPAPGNWSGTLVNALLGRGAAHLVHRLDKETSGLLVVAKSEKVQRQLQGALAARQLKRLYAALSWGHLASDHITVDRAVGRDPRDRKRMAIVTTGRPARTDFARLARYDSVDLLRARLHTGRTHQIRVHLASIGHPVVGDDTYGGGGGRRVVALPPHRHFLHAAWLRFRHPITGADMDLRSPLPEDLLRSLAAVSHEDTGLDDVGFYRIEPDDSR